MAGTLLKVLVVDDELGMRLGVERALRSHTLQLPDLESVLSFVVVQAETGEQGLELIDREKPDVVLLDHKLPGLSGLDVLERLEGKGLDLLVVMITAYASLDTAVTATKRGAFDFLAKPFTPDELKAVLRKTCRHLLLHRQAKRLAEEKRRVRFEFTSVLAHELKAPLAAVEGYLRLFVDRAQGDDIAAYDRMMSRCLIRLDGMRKLIFDLLDMTRIESGLKQREFTDLDLVEVARSSAETLAPSALEKKVTVEFHGLAALPMRGDRGELEIVLNNLISNAIKYNRDGGRVDVTFEATEDLVTLTVADSGIGMSEADCARLFRDFVRIKNDKTIHILGSGLGLSTVKKLATMYGGEAAVRSQPDVGSTFTVTLRRRSDPGGTPTA